MSNCFWIKKQGSPAGMAHIINHFRKVETEHGTEGEVHVAHCGAEQESWFSPQWGYVVEFRPLSVAKEHGVPICEICEQTDQAIRQTSEGKLVSWQVSFGLVCEEMKKNGERERNLPERGRISWCPDVKCPHCHSEGTFSGDDLEYGALYECAFGRYCPACQKVYDVVVGRNFAPYGSERFLPIMKIKLMVDPRPFQQPYLTKGTDFRPGCTFLIKNETGCPFCGGDTYTFHKDLGGIDYYGNFWTVCVNPDCTWPGEHRETYEQGPY